MRLKMAGALIPVLLRAIKLQRCRIVVRGILGQYQYYCMFCLVTHIVGSNFKIKRSLGSAINGCSTLWSISMKFKINAYQHFYLTGPNFQEIWKSQSLKIFTFKKKCHYFCTGVYETATPEYRDCHVKMWHVHTLMWWTIPTWRTHKYFLHTDILPHINKVECIIWIFHQAKTVRWWNNHSSNTTHSSPHPTLRQATFISHYIRMCR